LTDSAGDARRYSFRLLSYRGRSERELIEKLEKKGFSAEIISATAEYLKKAGFLDDRALALNLRRQALEQKLLGHSGARLLLLKRGIPGEIIDATLDYDEDAEARNLQKLVDKKLRSVGNYLSDRDKKKLWNFLARRGYSFSIIKKTLKDMRMHEEVCE